MKTTDKLKKVLEDLEGVSAKNIMELYEAIEKMGRPITPITRFAYTPLVVADMQIVGDNDDEVDNKILKEMDRNPFLKSAAVVFFLLEMLETNSDIYKKTIEEIKNAK
jgi:hypothetical protein